MGTIQSNCEYVLEYITIEKEEEMFQEVSDFDLNIIDIDINEEISSNNLFYWLFMEFLESYYDEYRDISKLRFNDIFLPFPVKFTLDTILPDDFYITLRYSDFPVLKIQDLRYNYTLLYPNKEYQDEWFEKKFTRFKDLKIKSTVIREPDGIRIKVIDDDVYRFLLRRLTDHQQFEALYQFDQRQRSEIENIVIEDQLRRTRVLIDMDYRIPKSQMESDLKMYRKLLTHKSDTRNWTILFLFFVFDENGYPKNMVIYPIDFDYTNQNMYSFQIFEEELFDLFLTLSFKLNEIDLQQLQRNYPKIINFDISSKPETILFNYNGLDYVIEAPYKVYLKDKNDQRLNHGDPQYKNIVLNGYITLKEKITSNQFNTNFFRDLRVENGWYNYKTQENIRIFR